MGAFLFDLLGWFLLCCFFLGLAGLAYALWLTWRGAGVVRLPVGDDFSDLDCIDVPFKVIE